MGILVIFLITNLNIIIFSAESADLNLVTSKSLNILDDINHSFHECLESQISPNTKSTDYDPEVGKVNKVPFQKLDKIKSVESISLPYLSLVLDIQSDPRNSQVIYASGPLIKDGKNNEDQLRIYKSTDGGKTWEILTDIPGESSGKISISENGTLMVLGDAPFHKEAKIYYSQDDGKSFKSFGQQIQKGRVQTLHLSQDGKTAYVADSLGQLYQHDLRNGEFVKSDSTFDPLTDTNGSTATPNAIYSITTFKDLPGKIFLGAGNHLYKVENNKKPLKMSNGVYNDTTVYNVEKTANGGIRFSGCNGIYETTKGHKIESEKNPTFKKLRSPSFIREQNGKMISTPGFLRTKWVTTNPQDSKEIIASSTTGLYKSSDGGISWKRLEVFKEENNSTVDEYQKIVWIDKDTILVQTGAYLNKNQQMLRVKIH